MFEKLLYPHSELLLSLLFDPVLLNKHPFQVNDFLLQIPHLLSELQNCVVIFECMAPNILPNHHVSFHHQLVGGP
jgi:hypothetical protein